MDRRQRKTREAIFKSFIKLLSKKHYNKITVGEILEGADVGRATFYAHFETKDFLLKELLEELFSHVFDVSKNGNVRHKYIFDCDKNSSSMLHLIEHLKNNDNNILDLLSCENNELFLRYFKENLLDLIEKERDIFKEKKPKCVPEEYWYNHIAVTFVETIKWWLDRTKDYSAEKIYDYFLAVL